MEGGEVEGAGCADGGYQIMERKRLRLRARYGCFNGAERADHEPLAARDRVS
jgi:hypothetical protein